MESKREQALVGLFVLVAAAVLIVTVLLLSGTFGSGNVAYKAYFKNAGGLAPGSEVHYAGGPSVGRVKKVESDPQNSTRMEVDFSVQPDVPIKTDSVAQITSNSPLGDNFLGIVPGSVAAAKAPEGSTLKSIEYTSFADLTDLLAQLGPNANTLITNLNERVVALKETMDRINDVLSPENRANISGSLSELHGMLGENRAVVHSALNNVNAMSAKLGPLLDDFRKTSAQANDTLAHIDATISEDRPELRKAIVDLRQSLDAAVTLTSQLNRSLDTNTENLDEILDNLRHVTENLNSFTETIKTRPYTLIRSSDVKPREPGQAPPK
jgi:phospholipid/cholesterol/gamma-HCH transport system substrate-binding protein